MREFFRFAHIYTDCFRCISLNDFNITLFTGELLFMVGLHGSGKRLVAKLFCGELPVREGKIWINEELQINYQSDTAQQHGIVYLDGCSRLSENLSVSDNLFLLNKHKLSKIIYRKKAAEKETAALLSQYRLTCPPDKKVYELTAFECLLLSIVKAILFGARLLILNLSEISLSDRDFKNLSDLLQQEKENNLTCLVISNTSNSIADIANAAVIMNSGRDVMTIRHPGISHNDIDLCMVPQRNPTFPENNLTSPLSYTYCIKSRSVERTFALWQPGSLIGFYNYDFDAIIDFSTYATRFLKENHAVIQLNSTCIIESCRDLHQTSIRWISECSESFLLDKLSIADNIMIPRYSKISGLTGYISPSLSEYCVKEFFAYFHISEHLQTISELNTLERRLLSIYRFVFPYTKAIFIDNPTTGLDEDEQKIIWNYLYDISMQGIAIFVTSRQFSTLHGNCKYILCTDGGHWRETFSDFK